ncbi:MAG: hypothetical protein DMG21_04915 [Acidobacteria bacterium]|nr:MAG: hypothetical protein DMG21_04915 [Acidobacteriota bacterium]
MSHPTQQRRSDRVEMALPVRIKGLSKQTKFFDEETETVLISKNGFMTRLLAPVDLETELLVTSLTNHRSGTFRVAWISDAPTNGVHNLGLELIKTEGDLWGIRFTLAELGEDEVRIKVWLACRRCGQKLLTEVPEAEYGPLDGGFLLARNCVTCRATTTWEFTTEGPDQTATEGDTATFGGASPSGSRQGGERPHRTPDTEQRKRGRAPLQMRVKVTRRQCGIQIEDVCETVNISRSGALFMTSQHYAVGETVQVVLPYTEGDVAIPIPAIVVRTDLPKDSLLRAVAVQLKPEPGGERGTDTPTRRRR